jgi:hypothetical protein
MAQKSPTPLKWRGAFLCHSIAAGKGNKAELGAHLQVNKLKLLPENTGCCIRNQEE